MTNKVSKETVVNFAPDNALKEPALNCNENTGAFVELERGVRAALETYSNVHRGSGYYSMVTTMLFEQARDIVLEHLDLNKDGTAVIFCSPRRAEILKASLRPTSYQSVSSRDLGLPFGVVALAVDRGALPRGVPFQTGGGTARLVSPGWVIWANAPDRFEAGTPAIVMIIAFARSLRLVQQYGKDVFQNMSASQILSAVDILYHDEQESISGKELLEKLRQTMIGRGVCIPTASGLRPFINLDNAASTPAFLPVWDAVWKTWLQPRQIHMEIVAEVKAICALVLNAPLKHFDVIFTSNTTEAINLAAESFFNENEPGIEPVVVNTLMEHNSNELPWRALPGVSLIRLPVDREGFLDLDDVETVLRAYNQENRYGRKRVRLVAVTGASNILGAFNDLAAISRVTHQYGARLLVDAAQMVAHRRVDVEGCEIDYLAFSAHKVYAPFGSGALLVRKGLLNFPPEELELIRSSGEENVGGIAAMGKALVLIQRIGWDVIQEEERALTERVLSGLAQIPGVTIYGVREPGSPRFKQKGGVIIFTLPKIMAPQAARELAEQGGIGIRAGCHCAHLMVKRVLGVPPLLEQFQGAMLNLFPRISLPGVARVSLGIENSAEDVDTFLLVLAQIASKAATRKSNPFADLQNSAPGYPRSGIQQQMKEFARVAGKNIYTQPG